MKNEVILSAQVLGYFRAKKPEKREAILQEMAELENFEGVDVAQVLQAEQTRRETLAKTRAARQLERVDSEACKPLTGGTDTATAHVQAMPPGKYVLTCAQNNTDVDPLFWETLQNYCKHNGAVLLVAKITYNLNGFQNGEQPGTYYASELQPFLVEGQINLGGVDFVAQANVLPTAKNPLSGFESITGVGTHAVIPATKIALKCTTSLKGGQGKILFSTGTVTKRNYILRKAGAVAATEHNIGALFVDTSSGGFTARQLERMPDSEGFFDLGYYYGPWGWIEPEPSKPAALQFGDIHAEKMAPENMQKMLDLVAFYLPENLILHDVLDFSSRNHHNIKDCAFMFAQQVAGNTVRGDIEKVAHVLDMLADTGAALHVIESNHDLAINTWLKNTDFKLDPANATVYLQCMAALYAHIKSGQAGGFNMLAYAYTSIGLGQHADKITFHDTDESVIMAGVEMGCHGHTGTNGSRGSPQQFRALGVPINTGHTHTPSILGACYTAGVAATLDMGYNVGASSWRLANILTWPNGQRQIIFM